MIGRRTFFSACGGLALVVPLLPLAALLATDAQAEQPRLGPYTTVELEAVRGRYEPFLRSVLVNDLLGRLTPAMRAPLGNVQLIIPAEMPPGLGADPAFVLNIGSVAAERKIYLPLRTAVWIDHYFGLAMHLERRKCPDAYGSPLLYAAMLVRSADKSARSPGPLAAFGLDESIYKDPFVKDVSNKFNAGAMFFLLAHELGHIAHGHVGGTTGIHSQAQEQEADAYAFDAMEIAGSEPFSLGYLFTAAAMMEGGQITHPPSGSRVDAAAKAVEARPRAFVDRGEPDPDAWVPRVLALAGQLRLSIPLIDDPQQRAQLAGTASSIDFAMLRSMHEKFCPQ